MNDANHKLTLHQPVTYRIRVPGKLDEIWLDWAGAMTIMFDGEDEGSPVTTLTGAMDQAALHSVLRRLYSLGIPLISVVWVAYDANE